MKPSWELKVTAFIKSITANPLRMRIFLLLYINPELYVTEISNILRKSKATVSRHLRVLKEEGVVRCKEVPDKKNIKKKYYSLNQERLRAILPKNFSDEFDIHISDPKKRLKLYSKLIEIIKSLKTLVSKGFDILEPLIDEMEAKSSDIEKADEEFYTYASYFFPERMIHFEPVLISRERMHKANDLYNEYRKNLRKIQIDGRKNNEKDSILIIHSVYPLRDMLERDKG